MIESTTLAAIRAAALAASIHPVAGVSGQPEIQLVDWCIIRPDPESGDLHLAGWNVQDAEGRMSSAIVGGFQRAGATWRATTISGRTYVLHGPGGHQLNPDAAHVLGGWLRFNRGCGLAESMILSAEETARVLGA